MWDLRFRTTIEKWGVVDFILSEFGAASVTISSGNSDWFDRQRLDTEKAIWTDFQVSAMFGELLSAEGASLAVRGMLDAPETLEVKEILDDIDWNIEWKKRWGQKILKSGLYITPSWLAIPKDVSASVRLDPGRAFGTGAHETTNLCLRILDEHLDLSELTIVDYGCGSGIISLVAAARGCRNVMATDIDSDAMEITRENVFLNCFQKEISVVPLHSFEQGSADLVIANILLDALIDLRPVFWNLLRAGGQLILSGITRSQISSLTSAYKMGFESMEIKEENDWVAITFRRH